MTIAKAKRTMPGLYTENSATKIANSIIITPRKCHHYKPRTDIK